MFKKDQKVFCKVHGEGVVTNVGGVVCIAYPVDVEFIGGAWDCYTEDGMIYEDDDEPSLSVIEE